MLTSVAYDQPKVIEFQTTTICNARCQICPYPDVRGAGRPAKMPDSIWHRILAGIGDLKPVRVIPYLNNEPLTDRNLAERIAAIKELIGDIEIEVSTNGLLLNREWAESLMHAGTTELLISVFGYDADSHKHVMGIDFDRVKSNVLGAIQVRQRMGASTSISIVQVGVPGLDETLLGKARLEWEAAGVFVRQYGYLDRAGNVSSRVAGGPQRDSSLPPRGCELNRHRERMYFLTDGTAIFCCHDWRVGQSVGALKESSMREIWNGACYSKVREQVEGDAPSNQSFLCRHCKLCPSS